MELRIINCSHSSRPWKESIKVSCNGEGTSLSNCRPSSVSDIKVRRLSTSDFLFKISAFFSSRSKISVTVPWLREIDLDSSETDNELWLDNSWSITSCGPVSPTVLCKNLEWRSIAWVILRSPISISLLRRSCVLSNIFSFRIPRYNFIITYSSRSSSTESVIVMLVCNEVYNKNHKFIA